MEFPKNSKYAFSVKSTSARPPKTDEPELHLIAGIKGKFKINEATSKLMGLKPYNYLAFVSNEDQIEEVKQAFADGDEETVAWVNEQEGGIDGLVPMWAIAKGWDLIDANGVPQTAKKPLTKAEAAKLVEAGEIDEDGKAIAPTIPARKGSRLASKMKEVKVGMILEGTDSTCAPALRKGHEDDKHVVFSVTKEAIAAEFPNGDTTVDVEVYPITFARTEQKIEKNKA